MDTLEQDRHRRLRQFDEHFHRYRKYWKEFSDRKDFPFDPFMYEMFFAVAVNAQEPPKDNKKDVKVEATTSPNGESNVKKEYKTNNTHCNKDDNTK
ncbi:MAG: hypothetical protein J5I91_02585 [Bacteroidetes bacterium]|nr:hypothetical protein [Bacteroidota bacterium]